ncbi:MAG: hypothetical protein ABIV50_01880 [Opitutus sp.]
MITPRRANVIAVVVFGALTLAVGVLRLRQIDARLSPADLTFGPVVNHVAWNSTTGELSATGGDPYVFFQIPSDSLPLDELVFECSGNPLTGSTVIYRSPSYLPDFVVDDRLTVAAKTESNARGYDLRFDLQGTKMVRVDLPDDYTNPLIIRAAHLRSRFIVGDNATFRIFATCLLGLVTTLIWLTAGAVISRSRLAEIVAVAVLVSVKLWLASDLHMTVYANAQHDDALFMNQGHSIASGDWLGKYGQLTLAKGPTYSIFIALVQLSRVPLLNAEAWLHAVACLLFVAAVKPVVKSAGIRLLLLGILLFDPHQFSSESAERALRSGIQPALTLLTLAGAIGLRTRLDQPLRTLLGWSLLGGVSLAAFWFSREEGVWLVPSLVLISGTAVWPFWRKRDAARTARLVCLLIPTAVCFSALWVLRAVNHQYYHSWVSVDVKDGGFPQAYGALTRITPELAIRGVPVTRETRLRAYEVSPAFSELRSALEGDVGIGWAKYGWTEVEAHPAAGKEIRGGWFQWALRQAASDAGHYADAQETSRYWQRVADEINAACDQGRLQGGRQHSGFAPRLDASMLSPIAHSFLGAADIVVRFSDFKSQSYLSTGDPSEIARLSRVLHEEPVVERRPPTLRTHLRNVLFHMYQNSGVTATLLALGAIVARCATLRWQPLLATDSVILLALVGGAAALMLIVSLVDVTSFRALYSAYLSPATPLVLAVWVLAPYAAVQHSSLVLEGEGRSAP